MSIGTVEVSLALDGAIVLARRIVKLQSDPVPGRKVGGSDEADSSSAAVVELDGLAEGEVGQFSHVTSQWPCCSLHRYPDDSPPQVPVLDRCFNRPNYDG